MFKKVNFEIPKDDLEESFRNLKVKNAEVMFEDEKSDWIEIRFLDEVTRRYRTISIKKEWVLNRGTNT